MNFYIFLPMAATIAGVLLAMLGRPSPPFASAFQHLAAGIVFAAAAGELLPEVMASPDAMPIFVGGVVGIVVTWLIKRVEQNFHGSVSFVVTVAVDLLVDGTIIGMAFVTGTHQGLLLAVALSVEVLFLGLALTSTLATQLSNPGILIIGVALGSLLPLGSLLGMSVSGLPHFYLIAGYTFGMMALLYLVTEELLVEAHQVYDTPETTAFFFVGFLTVTLFEHYLKSAGTLPN
jgi:ZIP family zinc transporter